MSLKYNPNLRVVRKANNPEKIEGRTNIAHEIIFSDITSGALGIYTRLSTLPEVFSYEEAYKISNCSKKTFDKYISELIQRKLIILEGEVK